MLGLCGALVEAGCSRVRYEPQIPVRTQGAGVEAAFVGARPFFGTVYTYELSGTQEHLLRAAWITVPSRPPCTGGLPVEKLTIDGASTNALPAGKHTLVVRDGDISHAVPDVVLDVVVDDGCLRVPARSSDVPLRARQRPLLSVGGLVAANTTVASSQGLAGLSAGLGHWAGPVLLAGALGVGVADCIKATCGENGQGNDRQGLALGGLVDARTGFTPVGPPSFAWILSGGARYSFWESRLPALEGPRWISQHTLAAIFASTAAADWHVFGHPERAQSIELAVPVGVTWSPQDAHTLGFMFGLDFRFLFPL